MHITGTEIALLTAIGLRIKMYREVRQLSWRETDDDAGLPVDTVKQLELGRPRAFEKLSLTSFCRLAKTLGVGPATLLGREAPPSPTHSQ